MMFNLIRHDVAKPSFLSVLVSGLRTQQRCAGELVSASESVNVLIDLQREAEVIEGENSRRRRMVQKSNG